MGTLHGLCDNYLKGFEHDVNVHVWERFFCSHFWSDAGSWAVLNPVQQETKTHNKTFPLYTQYAYIRDM